MRMVVALLVFSCLLSWIPGGISAEVVTTRLGGVAKFNCSAPTGGNVEWKRKLLKEFSYIYRHPWLQKVYKLGGRHNVSLDNQTGACDLVITNVTEGDAGKYFCTEITQTPEKRESHFELVVLSDDNPTCHVNTSDVLVDNDCDIDPDYIEFNCSIAYRGNVAPDMQLQMSSIGVLDNVTSRNWTQSTTTYMSFAWASKASWKMSGGRFRCEVMNTMVGLQPSCSSSNITVIYFYNQTLRLTSNKDIHTHRFATCAANTSENCSFKWRGTYRDSSDHLEVSGSTIDLKSRAVELPSMRCRAECTIRNTVCVSEPMFIEFPSVAGDSSPNIPAIILPILLVLLLGITIVLLLWKFKFKRKGKEEKIELSGNTWNSCNVEDNIKNSLGNCSVADSSREQQICRETQQETTEVNAVRQVIKTEYQQTESKRTPCIASQVNDHINLKNPTTADIDRYLEGFEKVLCELIDYIDPFNKLSFCCVRKQIMTFDEANTIERSKPPTTNEIIAKMKEYVNKDPQNCIRILEALIANDQMHIAKFIVSSGMNTRSPDRVLTKEERAAIDRNMFYLEKMVNTQTNDFLMLLVGEECITANHKEWIINYKKENRDVYQLFEIMKRRSFQHFIDFKSCLELTGQKLIVDVLRKGGVVEITNHLQGIENRIDLDVIENGIIYKLTGYLSHGKESQLNEEQQFFIDKLIDLLNKKENKIRFMGSFRTHSISLYFQCETIDSQEWLKNFCGNGELNTGLKTMFRSLQPELNSFSNFDIDVHMTHSSKIHSINTMCQQSSGSLGNKDDDDDEAQQQLDETEEEMAEEHGGESNNRNERKGKLVSEHTLKRTRLSEKVQVDTSVNANAFATHKTGSNEVNQILSVDQWEVNMAELGTETNKLKQQCRNELTSKCYQLKIHRTTDDGLEEVVRKFYESRTQPVLDKIKLIEDQWRTLDLWEILQSVNPRPILEFDQPKIFQKDKMLSINTPDDMGFRRSIIFCGVFEDLMRNLGWKVGDALDIEHDICNTVGKLMMQVTEQGRSSLLECMQSAMMNIQIHGSKQDRDKLRSLLIVKEKYNGLNLACILLEQMIIDNKDTKVSWMRIVCAQFIDLVCQLIIEPDDQEDTRWILKYLLGLESNWTVWDIYNLVKNGILMYQGRQEIFHRNLVRIRNLAVHPSMEVRLSNNEAPVPFEEILHCRDENKWTFLEPDVELHEDEEKSLELVLSELLDKNKKEVGQEEQESIKKIIEKSRQKLGEDENMYKQEIEQELKLIKNWTQTIREQYNDKYEQKIDRELKNLEEKDGLDLLPTCIALISMALKTCKKFKPLNTQLVSYCLLIDRKINNKGRLLEILTGEGKSCVIAMVAATYALLGRTVDIVTSSPVLSQRDAKDWEEFYSSLKLKVGCNVEDNRKKDSQCYKCPIVYGTVETFARDILKTKFLLQDVRNGRKCDIVIVDEVDSMLIDQGVQCTYLSHDVASIGLRHFEPILSLIWMNVSRFVELYDNGDMTWHRTEQELFFFTLCRISNDPLHILHQVEQKSEHMSGFTDKYVREPLEGQIKLLRSLNDSDVKRFFSLAREYLSKDINIYAARDDWNGGVLTGLSILVYKNGLSSIVLTGENVKKHLEKMITSVILDKTETGITLPIHLKEYCQRRLKYWIGNAFVAKQMKQDREYVVQDGAVYPVDYQSTGVTETNKKWGDGLQQFLEMKHCLPISPLSLITNFLSNVDFFDLYRNNTIDVCNIFGVSGTLGGKSEKTFMSDTFSVEFATIPTFKRRKWFELDGLIFEDESKWLDRMVKTVESVVANQRAVLVICEDIATADKMCKTLKNKVSEENFYLHYLVNHLRCTITDGCDGTPQKKLQPGNVVITTNLGARGTHFGTDETVNKNGGLFVLVTFIPLNDRVEKQAFGRTGRRGATGSCQIIVNRKELPKWLRLCETVEEAKCMRNEVNEHRLKISNEVKLMRNKQKLFDKYCEFKNKLVYSNNNLDSKVVTIQKEILDETWAKWIQKWETNGQKSNNDVEELSQHLETYFIQARSSVSDNIYHLLKFGAVKMMEGDFEKATEFYDQVIKNDRDWSAIAHYNKAYCTLQMKESDYIQHAIEDLEDAHCKFESYERSTLFSGIHGYASAVENRLRKSEVDQKSEVDVAEETRSIQTQYQIMMECQLLQHINTQITDTIQKLKTIKSIKWVGETMRRDILESILRADCGTEALLQKYSQLGLLFIYNIDKDPEFCNSSQVVASHGVLASMAVTILMAFSSGILLECDLSKLEDMIKKVCKIGTNRDDTLLWMSQGVSNAIITGFHSINFIRDVSSLLPIMQSDLKAGFELKTEINDKLAQFKERWQATSETLLESLASMTQEISKLASSKAEEISLHANNDGMESSSIHSIMSDSQVKMKLTFSSIHSTLSSCYDPRVDFYPRTKSKSMEELLSRLTQIHLDSKASPLLRCLIEARILSIYGECKITILDADHKPILRISSPDRKKCELIYSPPSPAYPSGHLESYINGKVDRIKRQEIRLYNFEVNYHLYHAAFVLHENTMSDSIIYFIDEHPHRNGELIAKEHYTWQLKRVCGSIWHEYLDLVSSHQTSCIKLALRYKTLSPLANVLAKYESDSRSVERIPQKLETAVMTSAVSRDACDIFLFSGSSGEADIYRKLVVERINDADITTALKLCCIGHQMLFCRRIMNDSPPNSEVHTLKDTFEQIHRIESNNQEKSKFLSICDEWYRVLEPQGMMNIQRELLREWINDRQYANADDPVVSNMIQNCSMSKLKEQERRWNKAKKLKEEESNREKMERNRANQKTVEIKEIHVDEPTTTVSTTTVPPTQSENKEPTNPQKDDRSFDVGKVLDDYSKELGQELEVSDIFLAKLFSWGIIRADQKNVIEMLSTTDLKVKKLITILKKKDDNIFRAFCSAVNENNSDLAKKILLQQSAHIEERKTPHGEQSLYDKIDLMNCHSSDIIKGFRELRRKGRDLEDYIDPENGLLHRLGSHKILDFSEIASLQKIAPYQSLNEKLLEIIERKIDAFSKQLIEALCEDEQDHIAKFIVTAGCETDSDERLLPRELRKIIDDNMFCLEKLIDTEKQDLIRRLVTAKCITSRHRDRVMRFENKARELLIILQRRKYRDFFNFMECLRNAMQRNIVKILENGGVTEIKVELLQKRGDMRSIEAELMRKLRGYVVDGNESDINEDQRRIVDSVLTDLKENDIHLVGTCTDTSNRDSMLLFFQAEHGYPKSESICESGLLKDTLETLCRALLNIPDNITPLVKTVTTGEHSNKHHLSIKTEQNSEIHVDEPTTTVSTTTVPPTQSENKEPTNPQKDDRSFDEIHVDDPKTVITTTLPPDAISNMDTTPLPTVIVDKATQSENKEPTIHQIDEGSFDDMDYKAELLRGITRVPKLGVPGRVIIYNSSAKPIVTGTNEEDVLMAAAQYGKGRVVVIAHDKYGKNFEHGRLSQDTELTKLQNNIKQWVSSGTFDGDECILNINNPVDTNKLNSHKILIWALGYGGIPTNDVLKFIWNGGGFVHCQCPWGWLQLNPGKTLNDIPYYDVLKYAGAVGYTEDCIVADKSGFKV